MSHSDKLNEWSVIKINSSNALVLDISSHSSILLIIYRFAMTMQLIIFALWKFFFDRLGIAICPETSSTANAEIVIKARVEVDM